MTRGEFIAKRKRYSRLSWLPLLGAGVGFVLAFVIAYSGALDFIKEFPGYIELPAVLLVLAPVVPGTLFGKWLAHRLAGMDCPHCSKPICEEYCGYVVIATGNCPHCGERVLGDGDEGKGGA